MRIAPQFDEEFLNVRPGYIVEKDAEALAVGELGVVAALAGEIGVKLETVAHIAHHDERWPFMR